jgi:hypothetical protein
MTDKIKLNDKGIRVYLSKLHRAQPDWRGRTGKIVKYNRDGSIASVIWDGNHSVDRVPVVLIEPADRGNLDDQDRRGQSSMEHTPSP